jgi:hypothetical protein
MSVFGQTPIGTGAISSGIKIGKPIYDLTIVGSLVASNQVNITINSGTPIAVVYSTSPAYTMQQIKAALIADPLVDNAYYLGYNRANDSYTVRFTGIYQNTLTLTSVSVTGGASQPTISATYVGGINEVPLTGDLQPNIKLSQRSDSSTTANKVYYGFALANSADDIPVWYIYVVDSTTSTIPETLFPNTGAGFDYVWDNRAALTYS